MKQQPLRYKFKVIEEKISGLEDKMEEIDNLVKKCQI